MTARGTAARTASSRARILRHGPPPPRGEGRGALRRGALHIRLSRQRDHILHRLLPRLRLLPERGHLRARGPGEGARRIRAARHDAPPARQGRTQHKPRHRPRTSRGPSPRRSTGSSSASPSCGTRAATRAWRRSIASRAGADIHAGFQVLLAHPGGEVFKCAGLSRDRRRGHTRDVPPDRALQARRRRYTLDRVFILSSPAGRTTPSASSTGWPSTSPWAACSSRS